MNGHYLASLGYLACSATFAYKSIEELQKGNYLMAAGYTIPALITAGFGVEQFLIGRLDVTGRFKGINFNRNSSQDVSVEERPE